MLSRKEGGFSKGFSRLKLKVDQNLGRAEATRPLNDESLDAERRIGDVQKAMERFSKAAKEFTEHCAKPPEDILVKSFEKNITTLGKDRDLGKIWETAAHAEKQLATERASLQSIIKSTIDDRCRHIEEQLSNVRRMRKDLDNYILDMDAARRRYTQVMRQQANIPNPGGQSSYTDGSWSSNSTSPPPPDPTSDVASAWQKVECARDSLEAEMNEIISHEYEYSEVVLRFLEEQVSYHERACRILNRTIPELRERLSDSVYRPVFGLPLSDHLRLWRRRIALVIEYCCLHLLKFGKTEEGLFRIAAGASKIRRLKSKFNSGKLNHYDWPPVVPSANEISGSLAESVGQSSMSSSPDFILPPTDPNDSGDIDVHALAGVLKQYLRDLPDPLLTSALSEEWSQAASLPEEDRLVVIQALLSRLPAENYENLRYLVHFLSLLTQFADQNRMTPANVGIVIGPSIMPSSARAAENAAAAAAMGANMQLTQPAVIVQTFIEHVDLLFPGRTAFKPEPNAYLYDGNNGNKSGVENKQQQQLKIPGNYRTLSPPPQNREPRLKSKCGSLDGVTLDDQTVPSIENLPAIDDEEIVDDGSSNKRRWSGVPSSGAFLTSDPKTAQNNNNGKTSKNEAQSTNNRPFNKKNLAPPAPHGSPRVVRALLHSIHSRNSRDITASASETASVNSSHFEESELKRGFHFNLPISAETSTPTLIGARSIMPSDMEITTGSSVRHEDQEAVAVLDTESMRRDRVTPGVKKEAVLADAALQRAIRAEVRRLKSKEMRNRFFSAEPGAGGSSSTSSNETPRMSMLAAGEGSASTINASIRVPTLPKSVLVFPPADQNQHQETSPVYASSSSGQSVAATGRYHQKLTATSSLTHVLYNSNNINELRRGSLPGKSYEDVQESSVDPEPRYSYYYNYHRNLLAGDSAMHRVSTIDRFESPETPEHLGGSQVVPGGVVRPAVPPPPVPVQQPVTMLAAAKPAVVNEIITNNRPVSSAIQPTLLPAFNRVSSDSDNNNNNNYFSGANGRQQLLPQASQPQLQRELPVGAGPGPSFPRRRAPIAPPKEPPPPPPPSTPPSTFYAVLQSHQQAQPQQQPNLPVPLVPSPAHPLRSASAKTVALVQTTPTNEYDPMKVRETSRPNDESRNLSDSNGDMVVTSL